MGANLRSNRTTAQTNLDTALVRGGDQVVVKEAKDEAKPLFFGGKTAVTTKRSQVRSRAMSMAIKGIIAESADIYIMVSLSRYGCVRFSIWCCSFSLV